jgi:hypothetical protein
MAAKTLLTISRDENERVRLMTIEKNILDWQDGINNAKREGREEGIHIGEDHIIEMLRSGKSLDEILRTYR